MVFTLAYRVNFPAFRLLDAESCSWNLRKRSDSLPNSSKPFHTKPIYQGQQQQPRAQQPAVKRARQDGSPSRSDREASTDPQPPLSTARIARLSCTRSGSTLVCHPTNVNRQNLAFSLAPTSERATTGSSPLTLAAFIGSVEGRQSMLNARALRRIEHLDDQNFRCYLHTIEFLSFTVAPVIDLQVRTSDDECVVEMIACKFEGSSLLAQQNRRFEASLRNHLRWRDVAWNEHLEHKEGKAERAAPPTVDSHAAARAAAPPPTRLDVTVTLDVALEVFTLPFTLLPLSAVEAPGSSMLHALLDRLIPVFLEQVVADYMQWVVDQSSSDSDSDLGPV